jgi:SdrD B-like domain/Peptidase_C39 like family
MRAWILSAALAAAVMGGLPTSTFAAPPPTPTPKAEPSPTQAKGKPAPTAVLPSPTATVSPTPKPAPPTATPVPPTATATPPATATATSAPTRAASPTAPAATATPVAVTPSPSTAATATSGASTSTGTGTLRGRTFVDANADGQFADGEAGLGQVSVKLTYANGLTRTATSDDAGAFSFDALAPGPYQVSVAVPMNYVATTDAAQDIEVVQDVDTEDVRFGLISTEAAGLTPDASGPEATGSDDEQIIALASVTSLPLRFAQGRDLMAQIQKRVLGDGLVWLGIPFRSQIDGGEFQYVNCGPASLTMVLAGFGLEVGPSQVRDYLNNLIDNFDTDLGTSLDVLSRIGREAGLTPMDLYSDQGGYRNWSTDAVRWHVQQGHPVITLVKYRNLPGHTSSVSEFDHYIVISGLTPNGFVYNDAAFSSTLGYGLEISDLELEYAWTNSSIPHHALALGLDPDKKALSFPELPRKPSQVVAEESATARAMRRLAAADESDSERAPLLSVTPFVSGAPAVVAETTVAAAPLIGESDRWQDDPSFDIPPPLEPGSPMGLTVEPSDQPTLEPRPGPGTEVPKLLTLIGGAWLLWSVWSLSGAIARRVPSFAFVRAAVVAALGLFRGGP